MFQHMNTLFNFTNLELFLSNVVIILSQMLVAKRCNIFWNREVLGSKNKLSVAHSIWNDQGRLNVFGRPIANTNVVLSIHSKGSMALRFYR